MTKEEAQIKLAALEAEREACLVAMKAGERARIRLKELNDLFEHIGEITEAKRALRDATAGPVFDQRGYWKTDRRIIKLTPQCIVLREDGADDNDVTRYRLSDGLKQGSRAGNEWADGIDVNAALALWAEWQEESTE